MVRGAPEDTTVDQIGSYGNVMIRRLKSVDGDGPRHLRREDNDQIASSLCEEITRVRRR